MANHMIQLFNSLPVVLRNSLRSGVGWLLIFLGIVGMMIPILPGIPFVLLGGWLLGWKFRVVRTLLERYPILQQYLPFQLGKVLNESKGQP
ncbi:MAG: hypothetical protein U0175_02280 [Caldilineaceae bacterium]